MSPSLLPADSFLLPSTGGVGWGGVGVAPGQCAPPGSCPRGSPGTQAQGPSMGRGLVLTPATTTKPGFRFFQLKVCFSTSVTSQGEETHAVIILLLFPRSSHDVECPAHKQRGLLT